MSTADTAPQDRVYPAWVNDCVRARYWSRIAVYPMGFAILTTLIAFAVNVSVDPLLTTLTKCALVYGTTVVVVTIPMLIYAHDVTNFHRRKLHIFGEHRAHQEAERYRNIALRWNSVFWMLSLSILVHMWIGKEDWKAYMRGET